MTLAFQDAIDSTIRSEEHGKALAMLRSYFWGSPSLASSLFVLKRMAALNGKAMPCRLAFLRSFTVEPVVPLIRAMSILHGIDLTVQVSDFNTYAQDVLDPTSSLYAFDPQIVVFAVQTRDLLPDLWCRFTEKAPEAARESARRALDDVRVWISAFRARSSAHIVLHLLEVPDPPATGILDAQVDCGQADVIREFNRELRRIAKQNTGTYVLDYEALIARFGRRAWNDEQKWLTMRMPISAGCLPELAREYLRFILPLTGKICKALVVDLDNTLWGGVVGEDGFDGIQVGPEYPGAAYLSLQRAILDLYQRGIILSVCSKNNITDAMEALQKHPAMLLRPEHFASLRINWNDKVKNLREIADELNIGTDALAFLDDNPVERELVRREMPEACVIDLPADPMGYADALRACPVFERLQVAQEDRERGSYYAQERLRREMSLATDSLESFYRSLEMVAQIGKPSSEMMTRVAQLTQKTNQFNCTTRRYSEQQLREMAAHPNWRIYCMRTRDRFGDNGIVGVSILRLDGENCEIDTFLLSCRVIGRTLETAFLAGICDKARVAGARVLRGWYLLTAKNGPAREFYPLNGFCVVEEHEGNVLYEIDLMNMSVVCPEWITCHVPAQEATLKNEEQSI
jgi:FkbH-like protein